MKVAERVVDAAFRTLNGRKGFDWWWDELDEDIQQEIRDEMLEAVDTVIDG